MRLRRPESGSRGREAGASRIFILSAGGAPPMENSHGARLPTSKKNYHSSFAPICICREDDDVAVITPAVGDGPNASDENTIVFGVAKFV